MVVDLEITLTELSRCTGLSVNHLVQLIKRGILPEGRKGVGADYKTRYVSAAACIEIITKHRSGTPWQARKPEKNKRLNWNSIR